MTKNFSIRSVSYTKIVLTIAGVDVSLTVDSTYETDENGMDSNTLSDQVDCVIALIKGRRIKFRNDAKNREHVMGMIFDAHRAREAEEDAAAAAAQEKTRRYIAVTPAAIVEAGNMPIIWGIGSTAELAIANANECTRSIGGRYETLPASDRLADYVEKWGAEPELDWIDKNDQGVADLLDGMRL